MRIHNESTIESMILNDDESSNIKDATYHFDSKDLYITFKSGAMYCYYAVPDLLWSGFKAAESKGRYFSSSIKGSYLFKRMDK